MLSCSPSSEIVLIHTTVNFTNTCSWSHFLILHSWSENFIETDMCILDFDLSFLDGLDSKILNNYQEPSDKSVPLASTVTPELTSLAEIMDDAEAADKISNAAQPIVSSVSTSSSKTLPSLQVMTNSANFTPVVIAEIRPVMKIATKTSGKDKASYINSSDISKYKI